MASADPLVSARGVVKNYQALRPLRIEALTLAPGDIVALTGLDAPAAEMLVGLLTGAVLPDSGDIQLFGRSTRDVVDSDAWLAMLDGVGIVTDRAVLIGQFSVEQNMAMPFTLTLDPVAEDVRPRVADLARTVGIGSDDLAMPVAQARPEIQTRVRVARALALNPSVLLAEHPSATLPRDAAKALGVDLNRIARARSLAVLAITADDVFAKALGGHVLRHEPATGALRPRSFWHKFNV